MMLIEIDITRSSETALPKEASTGALSLMSYHHDANQNRRLVLEQDYPFNGCLDEYATSDLHLMSS